MARKFTRRFDPDGPRNSEAEISEYDQITRSPVVDPNIADWSPQWTVDPHIADMNATEAEHARATPRPSTGPVMTVVGGSKHEIYHIAASCSVLTKDLALARRGDVNAQVASKSLSAARRTGLACIVCLPEVALSRGDNAQMKSCTVTTDTGQRRGTLLHWRRDDRNQWWGLVVYNGTTGECDVVPADRLRERIAAPTPGAPQTPSKSTAVQANLHTGSGWSAPHDLATARRYHQRSATAGNTDSMRELALLLAYRTNPPDLTGARHWWELAAADGDPNAMFHLARLHATLLDPPDLAGARYWYERAATNGDVGAMLELGSLLVDQLDESDVEAAIHWWEKASATGDYPSMIELGLLLGFRLVRPDYDRARLWLTRAAEAGYLFAMVNLGILLAFCAEPPDIDSGRQWLTRAATAGIPEAMTRLGLLLAYRIDPPDPESARRWFELASKAGDTNARRYLQELTTRS
ncbi:sel1 repeat family protein [Rhodococcus sp. KBS0724]|uniref:tetratricopeptide repeat protein n=1 Tax=Rhodococcus sp. KBS0724 TaxID=1179674 RepID=UPI00110E1555|nr:tetratricopeptide repeat protein [Rhodococcus sp. KBS0724]TSD40518.1 sel1 repeat family protein [Rhodococcus sp. KBS0724]